MGKIIKMPHGKSQELEKLFNITAPVVREALRFAPKTEPKAVKLAEKVRKAAIEKGGQLYETK